MRYRRAKIKGGTYFFTVNLANRSTTLLTDNINVLRLSIQEVKQRHPFKINAMVVLPEHLHAIWTLPNDDDDFPTRWALIKAGFSRRLPKEEHSSPSRAYKGERGIWQRRYWEHLIRDEQDLARHIDYIHYNPVKHGYIDQAVKWPHSSIHRYIASGTVTADWGTGMSFDDAGFGEIK